MTGILPFIKASHLRILFLISTSLIIIGLPFSLALMSIGSIAIAGVYILEGDYKGKFHRLKNNKVALLILAFFIWHFFSIFWSEDKAEGFSYALKILPFFSFPIVFSGTTSLRSSDKEKLLLLFLATLIVATTFYLVRNYFWLDMPTSDPRNAVIFTSHIRLSLFLCLALISLEILKLPKVLKLCLVALFIGFIWFIQSLTAVFVFTILAFTFAIGGFRIGYKFLRWIKLILAVIIVVTGASLAFTAIDYYSTPAFKPTPEFTPSGNKYNRKLDNGFVENGNYLWSYVCYKELEETWSKKTGKSIWANSSSGYPYYNALIRYLNNKGLTKDKQGVESLKDADISRIMTGNPYPNEWKFNGLNRRVRGILFFLEKSSMSGDFTGNSLTEKLVYQKMGLRLIKDNPLMGVGAGDFMNELTVYFRNQYPDIDSSKIRYPHNQFLSVYGRCGLVGILLFTVLLYRLFIYSRKDKYFNLRRAFVIIVCCSFLIEDTLDNQAGITFFCLLSGLFFIPSSLELEE